MANPPLDGSNRVATYYEPQRPAADDDPGRGRRLGIDVGTVRIGLALSDPDGILASPLRTVRATDDGGDVRQVATVVEENFVVEVIIGLPVALRGNSTASTDKASAFAAALAEELDSRLGQRVPIRMVDERMSTVAATAAMHASGVNTKKGRKRIDQAAAVHILQGWLDGRKRVLNTPNSGE
ncbi:Holliday junction resolvase RuvX [Corynebacterium auriscanis]|uniref:Holliday junction resolvase RuvX n=1 Tax=Corynebacterium auriscanis TaxID=99807 RepID=UPI0024ACF8BE|nr:Holliday junction resolvase RuvX [Corynebacterium auriscanis]